MGVVTGAVVQALTRTREAPAPATGTGSDVYAAPLRAEGRTYDPQDSADAAFRCPPGWVRILLGLRQLAVRTVGIEAADRHVFDTLDRCEAASTPTSSATSIPGWCAACWHAQHSG